MVYEYKAGRTLAHPPSGEEIVITGMAGRFPESNNISEFTKNIYNKVDMVTDDNRRWSPTNPEIPHRSGKLNCIEKFDAGYFGISYTEADQMDPILRIMLEKTYEAIVDSGYGTRELNNTKVGVFVGTIESDSEDVALLQPSRWPNFAITGCSRSVVAQKIGHHFNFDGPTCVVNTGCSSSLYAFEEAYRALREDRCESAIVAGGSLCLNSIVTLDFWRSGVLAADGSCKVFDERANGYVRSEAIAVVHLQKLRNARRIYAQVVHVKTNSDGYKEEGMTFPLREMHMRLYQDTYSDCMIAPSSIDLLEAHGTGTRIGDVEETAAIDAVFCRNRKEPLPIGSVKSYMGHTEGASFLPSLVKVLVGMENNHILPNINFKTPNRYIEGLIEGRLLVPVEIMPWPEKGSGLAAINSFGIGGSNAHLVLKRFCKKKPVEGLLHDGLPRLMCVSGRSEECVQCILNDIGNREIDIEYCRLIQQVFKDSESCESVHSHRGFIIRSKRDVIERRCAKVAYQKRELHLFFSEPNREIVEIGRQLYELQPFAEAVRRVSSMLSGEEVAVEDLVAEGRFQSTAQLVLVNLAVQLSLVDLFKKVNCPISYFTGRSLGTLAAAYANGVFSMEQAVSTLLRDNDTGQIRQLPGRLAGDREHSRDLVSITFGSVKHGSDCSSQLNVSSTNTVHSLLSVLGNAYMMGFPISQELLYPPVNWPVSRGTPMISPIIKWNHDMDWLYTKTVPPQIERKVTVLAKDAEWSCLPGHVINGLSVMPAAGYLYIVWETFSRLLEVPLSVTRVTFENIKFHSMTLISDNCNEFYVTISKITHKFEVRNLDDLVVSGNIFTTIAHRECTLHTPVTEVIKEYFSSQDIYKELHLRGYNYSGAFRGLEQSDLSGTVSMIKWKTNWIIFMDCILQSTFVGLDTRNLYIPSVIEQLTIDAPRHLAYTKGESRAVYNQRETNIISSEGVQVRGFSTISVTPRKHTKPLIESYKFVPLETQLPLGVAVRVLVQIFVESSLTFNVKVVEVVENNYEADGLGPLFEEALNDQPLVKSKVSILRTTEVLKSKCLSHESQCSVILLREASTNPHLLSDANRALREDGIVISRENPNFNSLSCEDFVIASVLKTEKETLVLLTKASHFLEYKIITTNLNGSKFDWMEEVQGAVKYEENVLLVVQNEPLSGVLGFTNCLRRELGAAKLKCVFLMDEDARFNVSDPFFFQQLQRGLAINILKDGVWGTYRHLLLEDEKEVERQHIFNDLLIPGDYSSLRWVEGPLSLESQKAIVRVFSAGVNFKDVMAASGKIPYDAFTTQRIRQSTAQGGEFAGKDLRGRRVMGFVLHGALSTLVEADVSLLWPIPDNWSMEDGASVPIAYSTVLYGIVSLARIVHGESILIHSGSGGVGQAAINLALRYKCDIFTTVGSEEKRQFIKDTFPAIPESHIGNSRECSFEQMVLKYTKGRGVNIVMNSLSKQNLEASLRCLARNGRFIEIGNIDLVSNKNISLSNLAGGRRYCGVMMDDAFLFNHPSVKTILWDIVHNALENGIIKPLRCTSYTRDDVEHIYRNMAAGNHIGKLIVKIREEAQQSPTVFKGLPRFWCDSHMTYVVVGGLGGFGLELVDWMVLKGGRKFLLISRSGIKNGYAASRIRVWESYGAIVHVVTDDISNPESCAQILIKAEKLGPIAGIFNLAVVLQDALFENQTERGFIEALTPKATITHNLDKLSRKLCPNLKYFVVFSSLSCGRGNVGQTNYGMGNSIAERICEKRKKEGFPGLAIQWGMIGDVGILAENRMKINELGSIPQRISSCLSCLERFLLQREPVVSSMCISKARSVMEGTISVIAAIKTALGISDLKTVSEHTTFAKLGMDSMSTVEVRQILDRNADVYINARDVRSLTFAKLKELLSYQWTESNGKPEKEIEEGVSIKVHSLANDERDAPLVYMLPEIELTASALTPLVRNLDAHVIYLPFTENQTDLDLESLAKSFVTRMEIDNNKFNLIAYSYGCAVALEVASVLESKGKTGNVILIDGSIEIIKDLIEQDMNSKLTNKMESSVLPNIFHNFTKEMNTDVMLEFGKLKELISDTENKFVHNSKELYQIASRLRSVIAYKPNFSKIISQVTLFKSSEGVLDNYDEDFKLQRYCIKPIKVQVVSGDHQSIIRNTDLASAVNCIINNS